MDDGRHPINAAEVVFHEGAVSWRATIKPERNAAEAAIREGAVSWRTTIKSALIKRGAWHCGVIASLYT